MSGKMHAHEFGDHELPFVMGSVTGLRAWNLGNPNPSMTGTYQAGAGMLKAVAHNWFWADGENVAECFARVHDKDCASQALRGGTYTAGPAMVAGAFYYAHMSYACDCVATTGCDDLVGLDCGCGCWGYFGGTNSLSYGGSVVGVIEGYGRVVEGTLGFRAGKAKIRALFLPTYGDLGIDETTAYTPAGARRHLITDREDGYEALTVVREQVGLRQLVLVTERERNQIAAQYKSAQIFDDYAAMREAWPVDQPPTQEES